MPRLRTENPIRYDDVMESRKTDEMIGCPYGAECDVYADRRWSMLFRGSWREEFLIQTPIWGMGGQYG